MGQRKKVHNKRRKIMKIVNITLISLSLTLSSFAFAGFDGEESSTDNICSDLYIDGTLDINEDAFDAIAAYLESFNTILGAKDNEIQLRSKLQIKKFDPATISIALEKTIMEVSLVTLDSSSSIDIENGGESVKCLAVVKPQGGSSVRPIFTVFLEYPLQTEKASKTQTVSISNNVRVIKVDLTTFRTR